MHPTGAEQILIVDDTPTNIDILGGMLEEDYAVRVALKADPATRDIPVIFITARTDAASETQALSAGGVDFIHKRAKEGGRDRLTVFPPGGFDDRLAGAYNRPFLEKQVAVECARAQRSGRIVSLLLVGFDDFKAYTDSDGHPAGDEILARPGATMTCPW